MACQQSLTRTAHPHRQGQQRQHCGVAGIAVHQRLVAAHPGVVIHVARLGHTDDRVNQQTGLVFARGPQRQLEMSPMQWVAGLEGHHTLPAELAKAATGLLGSQAQAHEIVVRRQLQPLQPARDGNVVGALEQMGHTGVLAIGGAVDRFGFLLSFNLPLIFDVQDGNRQALGISQDQRGSGRQLLGQLFGDIESYGKRPESAVSQSHIGTNGLVVLLSEESL